MRGDIMLISWVKSGLLFGVFASVILMLCPNKSYMKHIGMVVGLLFILVMLHPLMELLCVDADAYAGYIKNFLMLETENTDFSEENRQLYEVSLATQLKAVFIEKGYPVTEVCVKTNQSGIVEEIILSFGTGTFDLQNVENYLHRLLGEDVRITYE
ncbi:MAG: stage III sporulation protein AF [Clostridiales bacterium]|nr:stage III sporulation protein AF [Clostridiales bacterium]